MSVLFEDRGKLVPLCFCRIGARGIVAAALEDEDASRRSGTGGLDDGAEVDGSVLGVVVGILGDLHPNQFEHGLVVAPGWDTDKDLGPRRDTLAEGQYRNVIRSCARYCLHGCDLGLLVVDGVMTGWLEHT